MEIEDLLKTNSDLPLSKKAVVSILYTNSFVNNILNDVLKPFDISIQQFNVLRILRGQHGAPASLETVQDLMVNKMSNTTRLIDKLIKKGFVKKTINKKNRRKIDITISKEGLNLLDIIDKLIDDAEKKIIDSLKNDEVQQLIKLLGKVRLIAK